MEASATLRGDDEHGSKDEAEIRSESIAALRAKAQEYSAKVLQDASSKQHGSSHSPPQDDDDNSNSSLNIEYLSDGQ